MSGDGQESEPFRLALLKVRTIAIGFAFVPLLFFGSASASADPTLADFMKALKGVTGASVNVSRTPIYDSIGCGVDEKMLHAVLQTHAERNDFRIAGESTGEDLTLVVSVLHFRVKDASECTASVEVTLRTDTEYNGAHLPLMIWSSQALMTVNKAELSRRVGEQAESLLTLFFAVWKSANR